MDLLTHIFIPLSIAKIMERKLDLLSLFIISIFTLLPDFDVFLGLHRGLFHSLLFIFPLSLALIALGKLFKFEKLSKFLVLALFLHLFFDFLTGGVPFLYPLFNVGIGVEFPLVIKFSSFPYIIVEYLPKIVFNSPSPVYGKTSNLISPFGIVSLFLFILVYFRERK